MNKLQFMLDTQKKLQDRLKTLDFKNEQERTLFIKHHSQYIDQELHEMLRELPFFKEWKNYDNWDHEAKRELAKEEFVDVFHFVLNIALALDMDAEELFNRYLAKNNINHVRQDNGY